MLGVGLHLPLRVPRSSRPWSLGGKEIHVLENEEKGKSLEAANEKAAYPRLWDISGQIIQRVKQDVKT
jgi:hypothetical protein